MKKCRTVKGLITAINKKEPAHLRVWGIMKNPFDKDGAFLNLGAGKYAYVGSKNWALIKSYVTVVKESKDGVKSY